MSNKLHDNLIPSAIITLFRNNQRDHYAEINLITEREGMLPARPLALKDIKEFIDYFRDKIKQKQERTHWWNGLLPDNVWYCNFVNNQYTLIWECTQRTHTLHFSKDSRFKRVKAKFPRTIFVAQNNELSVYWAIDSMQSERMLLYECMFPNTMSKGKVCFGNIELDMPRAISYNDLINRWEEYYFNSYFTESHLNEEAIKEYVRLSTDKKSVFNTELMQSCEFKNMGELVKSITHDL